MTLKKQSVGIFVDDIDEDTFRQMDSIVFDCDGVLIDITKSYDLTIIKTTRYVLETFAGITDSIDVDFKIIDGFKSTGGFNDEVDLTYAVILSIVAAKKLEKNQAEFIFDVIKNIDSTGISSVEEYIKQLVDVSEIKNQMKYPGTHYENPLYQIFDQIFYGPELYLKLFNRTSIFSEPGLIEQDEVILNDILIQKLDKRFNSKLAIVTGRGKDSVRYSLKELLDKFDLSNSVFLEDESRDLAKPNPKPLLDTVCGLKSTSALYVGDSMEDFIMAKKVNDLGTKTTFCGIIGTSKNPQEKLKLFEQNGASLVLESINLLPKALNLE